MFGYRGFDGRVAEFVTVAITPALSLSPDRVVEIVLLRHLRPCLHVRLISSSLFSSPSPNPQKSLSLSPLSSLFLNSRGFVGYPRKYDASVFRAAGSYRDVHEMADADADAPTDSSGQKKDYFVYTIPREHEPVLLKASYVDMLVLLLGRVPWRYNVGGGGCAPSYRIRCLGLLLLFAQ
ncbi:hypothetical protein AAC387_Pa01g4198 [Persea americana]